MSWPPLLERLASFARARRWSPERIADLTALGAGICFALCAAWGIGQVHGWGHLGTGLVGNAMIGENCFRWKTLYPSFGFYTDSQAPQAEWMCSHPYGMFWIGGFAVWLLGHRDFVVPLPAVLMSIATVWLLYRTAREAWGRLSGAAAVVGFSSLPIAMAYARFQSLEVLCMFGAALFFWGQLRYQRSGQTRYLVASLVGVAITGSGDWPGYLMVGALLGWSLLRAHVLPEHATPVVPFRRYTRWWALSATVAVLMFCFWVALYYNANRIGCWLEQAQRRQGAPETLAATLARRRPWIDASFTPPAILIGKIAALVAVVRAFVFRRDEEFFSLAVLFAASVQYVGFRNGADVHPFWPHYFAMYFSLACAQLVATAEHLGKRFGKISGLVLIALVLILVLPDGLRVQKLWKITGGQYRPGAHTNGDMAVVLERIVRGRLGKSGVALAHESAHWAYEHTWAIARPAIASGVPPKIAHTTERALWVGRGSELSGAVWKDLTRDAHVEAYGDIWIVDPTHGPEPLDAFTLGEREPNLLQFWLYSATEPVREIGSEPDPFSTWELRRHVDQPGAYPEKTPISLEQLRIAHNAAVDRGDAALAGDLAKRLLGSLAQKYAADLRGARIIGTRVAEGVQPNLEIWVECQEPPIEDTRVTMSSQIVKRARGSLIPIDPEVIKVVVAAPIPATLWRRGFFYRISMPIMHRPGTEVFSAAWPGSPETEVGRYGDG